jgi:hypothetical protein
MPKYTQEFRRKFRIELATQEFSPLGYNAVWVLALKMEALSLRTIQYIPEYRTPKCVRVFIIYPHTKLHMPGSKS